MTVNTPSMLGSLAPLLEYPARDYHDLAEACLAGSESAEGDEASAARLFSSFMDRIRASSVEELEELYTRTFDLNPTCSLDIGWHLYGEQYARGDFLVSLRSALRTHRIEEASELPDHLPSVLRLLSRCSEEEAAKLVSASVQPAVTKMLEVFPDDANPYSILLRVVQEVLRSVTTQPTEDQTHD